MNEKVMGALADIENIYMDSWGLIGTRWSEGIDGGDSSHKMSHLAIALHLNNMDQDGVAALATIHRHGLVRHPDPAKWYSNPRTFSRDQFSPRVIAGALMGIRTAVREYRDVHAKHWYLYAWNDWPSWNKPGPFKETLGVNDKFPDLTGPENYSFYIRGLRQWFRYPFLLLADVQTVIDALIKRFDSDLDVNNTLAATLLAMRVMPTGLGHLAWFILKPIVVDKLRAYWSKDRNEPPIDVIYIEGLKKQGYL